MANEKNLKPLTTEKAREIGIKGGIASGKTKKKKKQVKELLEILLQNDSKNISPKILAKVEKFFPDVEPKTIEDILNLSMIKEGVKGNVQAYNAVYDRIEGKPKQKSETDITTQGEKLVVYIPQEKND